MIGGCEDKYQVDWTKCWEATRLGSYEKALHEDVGRCIHVSVAHLRRSSNLSRRRQYGTLCYLYAGGATCNF